MRGSELCCEDCRHCMTVYDEFFVQGARGVCTLLQRMVGLKAAVKGQCSSFESRVPQEPYTPTLPPDFPRLLDMKVLKELRLALHHAGELVLVLELQPRVER